MNVITNNDTKCVLALAALEDVVDPEIGLNIVDLGLIYKINFDETNSKINTAMTLTSQFCPMGEYITMAATRALQNAFTGMEVSLELTFNPPWSHIRLSEKGLKFLNR